MTENSDIVFMQRAIELAKRGVGFVNPNPLVGCVVVKDGLVVREGWHERYGGFHAERNALNDCKQDCYGASLYVTLEPCCHYGKTPPCTEIIIEKGIKKVVVGLQDPNPKVAGKGIAILREAGIEVETGVEADKIRELNKVFLKYITTRRPYVVMKTAMTLDGKIATETGDSRWVTNEESRKSVHRLRHSLMGVVVGINTVNQDNPMLNCRLEGKVSQPIRIVADSKASISLESLIVKTARDFKTIVAHTEDAGPFKINTLNGLGVETLCCEKKDGRLDITDLMKKLGEQSIDSLLLEGGATLNAAFLKEKCVDEVYAYIAPKIVGGHNAKGAVGNLGISLMDDAIKLKDIDLSRFGDDVLIKGKIVY